ncbi:helix-turn-helix domain-containing protein [Nonomuraea sp. NPDC001699]
MIAEPTERPQLRERLMKPGEVARLFGVEIDTVRDWVAAGHLEAIRTPGGQLRFAPVTVVALFKRCPTTAEAVAS